MALRLLYPGTATTLRLLGGRRFRHQAGPVSMVVYAVGPPDGEPWVLLHGLGSTALSWASVVRVLRQDCRILIPELSALGGTRSPWAGLAVRQAVPAVANLIGARFPGRPVTLAGNSLGGWVAARLALERPELVSRLLLVDAGGYRDQDWDRIRRLVTVRDMAGVDELYGALFVDVPLFFKAIRRIVLTAYASPPVRDVLTGLAPEDVFDDGDLARIRVPTGLIWGSHDGLFEPAIAQAMAAALPRSQLQLLPECGHAVHWECPRRLAAAAVRFRASMPVEAAAIE